MPTPTWPAVGVIGKLATQKVAPPPAQEGLVRPGDHLIDDLAQYLTDESGNQLTG